MNLTLIRTDSASNGVFGQLEGEDINFLLTLEHAYLSGPTYVAKIPPGTYICVRGIHKLNGMIDQFETFEIKGVDGHSGLLFHWGNFNKDSSGCILLGTLRAQDEILNSRRAFEIFMQWQLGVNSFEIQIS